MQRRRLGWVGNSSTVLAAAAAEGPDYACLQPHDDVLEDDYIAVLLAEAEVNPTAAVVYSDIQSFGTRDSVLRQPTIAGSPFERQIGLLRDHFDAVAFRGLIRVSALRSILPMTGNPCDDFAADTVWMARQALVGDLVRVPRTLYRKRYHADNTHTQWFTWSYGRRMTAWIRHCLDMLAEALKASNTRPERRMLHRAARMRLLQRATATSGPRPASPEGEKLPSRACLFWPCVLLTESSGARLEHAWGVPINHQHPPRGVTDAWPPCIVPAVRPSEELEVSVGSREVTYDPKDDPSYRDLGNVSGARTRSGTG